MQWLRDNLIASIVGLGVLLVLVWRSGFVPGLAKSLVSIVRAVRESQLRQALRKCAELETANAELTEALTVEVRNNGIREDINKQDRATIRALVAKVDEHNRAHLTLADERLCLIDYSDLHEEVQRALGL
jgi:hypothetical protein